MLSRLTPYAEEITGDHQRGFSTQQVKSDNKICIVQILEKI